MSTDIYKKFAKALEMFPDDRTEILERQRVVSDLLSSKEYANLPETKRFIDLCRRDILAARRQLATNRNLSEEARRAFWAVIDARDWFLAMVVKDYDAVLTSIDRELDAELGK